jgi:hypothetical protein
MFAKSEFFMILRAQRHHYAAFRIHGASKAGQQQRSARFRQLVL